MSSGSSRCQAIMDLIDRCLADVDRSGTPNSEACEPDGPGPVRQGREADARLADA